MAHDRPGSPVLGTRLKGERTAFAPVEPKVGPVAARDPHGKHVPAFSQVLDRLLLERNRGHLFEVGVMPGIKLSLQHLGVDCGPCRAPFRILSDAGRAPLSAFLEQPDVSPWLSIE